MSMTPGELIELANQLLIVAGRIPGVITVTGPPANTLGAVGSSAFWAEERTWYGPKTADGWPPGVVVTQGPDGLSAKQIVINAGLLPPGATDAQFAAWLADAQIDKVQPLVDAAETARDGAQQALTDTEALAGQIIEDSTPDITVTAVAGAPGTPASVVKGGTLKAPTFEVTVPRGADGEEVGLRKSATHVQWRLGDGAWTNLVALADLTGADGREVQLQASATHIQWRYVGETAWTNIVALSAFTGPPGNAAWSPIYANLADGARRVQRLVDWIGGQGTKPATGKYLGPAGLVDTAAEATDIRGASGAGTGDMLGSNNLNDVTDKATSRQNLSVWSRAEIGPVDADYLSIIDAADQAGLSFAPTGINFAKNTGRLDYVDAASAAAVPGLTYTRTGSATAWRKDGTLAEFAPNVMRRTDAGVTIEGQRTNLFARWDPTLEQISTKGGYVSNVQPPANAPLTGRNWVGLGAGNTSTPAYMYIQCSSVASSTTVTLSFLCETPDGTPPVYGTAAGDDFDVGFINGHPPTGISFSTIRRSGNIWECRLTGVTSAAGASVYAGVRRSSAAQNQRPLKFSGFQLELGARASTPIITTGAAATVGADNLALAKTIAAGEDFTALVEAVIQPSVGLVGSLLAVSDGTIANQVYIRRSTGGSLSAQTTVGGVATSTLSAAFASGGKAKCAIRRSGKSITLAVNGVVVGQDGQPSASIALSRINIGTRADVGQGEPSTYNSTTLFPFALTDAELVEMTK